MSSSTVYEMKSAGLTPRYAAPIWTLLLISPFLGEVLSGSTRTSFLFVFVPEVMVWGVGALLCRELARRWRAGGTSLLLLGLALAIAEEFIIQQTSLAPLPFPGIHPGYGRVGGINLVYFLFMLGYESVWVVMVPVKVTELCFPSWANRSWLRLRGITLACVVFLLGSRIAWYGWTQQARPRMHAAPYHPPPGMIGFGLLMIAALIAAAYLVRGFGQPTSEDCRRTVPVLLAGLTAFVMGAAWFELLGQCFKPKPVQPFWIAIFAGAGWAILAFTLFVRWSSRQAWGDGYRFAASSGATLACIAVPYLSIASWSKVDVTGKVIFDVCAFVGMVALARSVLARVRSASADRYGGHAH